MQNTGAKITVKETASKKRKLQGFNLKSTERLFRLAVVRKSHIVININIP